MYGREWQRSWSWLVPINLDIWPSDTSGWLRMIQAIPSGLSWRVDTAFNADPVRADLIRLLLHVQQIVESAGRVDLFLIKLAARMDRVRSACTAVSSAIACTSRICRPQNAAILLKGERCVVDQPGSVSHGA